MLRQDQSGNFLYQEEKIDFYLNGFQMDTDVIGDLETIPCYEIEKIDFDRSGFRTINGRPGIFITTK